jgi:hypothetical protein
MSYCTNCKRYLNGALSCAGCGTEVQEDGQPTMPLPAIGPDGRPLSSTSSAAAQRGKPGLIVSPGAFMESDSLSERAEHNRPGWMTTRALVGGAVAVLVGLGAVIFVASSGGQAGGPPAPNSTLAGPGDQNPLNAVPLIMNSSGLSPSASLRATASTSASPSAKATPRPSIESAGTTPSQDATATPTPSPSILHGTPTVSSVTVTASQYSATNNTGVQTTSDVGGGENVGWITETSWLEYSNVNFGTSLTGLIRARIASPVQNTDFASIQFRLDSLTAPPFATIPVSGTGGWQNWVTSANATASPIPSGTHTLYVTFASTGGGDLVNLNWFTIS